MIARQRDSRFRVILALPLSLCCDCLPRVWRLTPFSRLRLSTAAGYNHITESMHTLNDMSHEDMGLAQHYDDPHGEYGLEPPTNQTTFLEHEFYPSHPGIPIQDAKYQPHFASGKTFLPRGLRFYGSWIEGMLPLSLSSSCFTPSPPLLLLLLPSSPLLLRLDSLATIPTD